MILHDSGASKKKNTLGITSLKGSKKKVTKSKGGLVKGVIDWLKRPQSEMFKSTKKKSSSKKKKSKSVMETSTAKKNAEKTIAGLPGSKKTSSKTSKPSSSSSKKKSSSAHKSAPSTHKSTSSTKRSTSSSAKKDAVKRVAGSTTKTTSAKKETKKSTKVSSKKDTKSTAKKTTSSESKIKEAYKKGADSYYNNQKSLLDSGKAGELTDIQNAYLQSMEVENKNKRDTNNSYQDRLGEINEDAYRQAQLTQIGAYENGLQNSAQLLALQAGDAYRSSNQKQGAMTERDRLLADINGRISTITKTKLNDVNKVNSQYNINLRGARASADQIYWDKTSDFDTSKYEQDRQHAWDVEDRNANFAHDKDMAKLSASLSGGSGGGGGGGRSSAYGRASSGGSTSSKGLSGLQNQANQYKQAKQTTPLSSYNNSFANKNQSVVVRNKYPLGAPPTVNQNPNLTAWDKMKMIGG